MEFELATVRLGLPFRINIRFPVITVCPDTSEGRICAVASNIVEVLVGPIGQNIACSTASSFCPSTGWNGPIPYVLNGTGYYVFFTPSLSGAGLLRHIPVVMFSSSGVPKDIQRAYELGANAYVVKPYTHDELKTALEHVFGFWFDENRSIVVFCS